MSGDENPSVHRSTWIFRQSGFHLRLDTQILPFKRREPLNRWLPYIPVTNNVTL